MSKAWDQVTWQEIEIGGVLTEPGTARDYHTGDWRSMRPVWDKSRCIKCGVCWTVCPEAGISEEPDGYFEMNDLLQRLRHLRQRVRHRLHQDGAGGGLMMAYAKAQRSAWKFPSR